MSLTYKTSKLDIKMEKYNIGIFIIIHLPLFNRVFVIKTRNQPLIYQKITKK